MSKIIVATQLLLLCGLHFAWTAAPLKRYDVDKDTVSVSGISAGAAFASQMHVAFSSQIIGVGSIAGPGPYYCAQGSLIEALNVCMNFPDLIDVPSLVSETSRLESSGAIDSTSNLRNSKVFMYHGTEDYTVNPGASDKAVDYYRAYSADLKISSELQAGHAFPTKDLGNPCDSSYSPFINRCDFDAAYEMLNHFYGGLRRPNANTEIRGQLLEFDQSEFAGTSWSFDADGGYIYIPSGCSESAEKPHNSMSNGECSVDQSDREPCGRQGISQNQCLQEGCCWELELPYFCFQKNRQVDQCAVDASDREECGFSGITEGQCGERGCCWREELPYFCYNKKNTGPPPVGGKCKLHFAFHGCSMGREDIGDVFARNAGYLETAEENNIVVVFPQIVANLLGNPNGCFDWWGYEDSNYAVKSGTQMRAVKSMMDRITG